MADSAVIYDGELKQSAEAAVPVTSRGLMYGDGCFETFRSYSGRFLKLREHLKRLNEGLNFLNIHKPEGLKADLLISQFKALLHKNNLMNVDAVIRLQVWREGERGYGYEENSGSHFSIAASSLQQQKKAYRLATVAIKRIPSKSLPANYKLSNGINYILAAKQARHKQADDALMETIENHVSETTIANIFWWRDGTVFTPSIDCDILPGITREIVIHLLRNKMNIEVKEDAFRVEALKKADMVFICNSVKEVAPVGKIDETIFKTETPFIQELEKAFISFRNEHLS